MSGDIVGRPRPARALRARARPTAPALHRTAGGGVILYHGGVPGLRPGDRIVPHERNLVDGCPICDARKNGLIVTIDGHAIDPPTIDTDRVYVTSDREYARFYAAKYPHGDLYTVDVAGELLPSEEDVFPTWRAEIVTVRGVYQRYVELTWPQRRRLARRWAEADRRIA